MSCNCENTQCIEVYLDPCAEIIELPLVADSNGAWKMIYEFNGMEYRADIIAILGSKLTIPAKFNENYKHILRFYKPDGSLFMDTCFTLKVMVTIFVTASATTPPGVVFDVEITEDGPSFTDIRMEGKEVATFATNTQDYNAPYFDKPLASDTLTVTDAYGGEFYAGQIITITLKH